ncbi:hypothetical protein [Aquipseudomonas campi]
MQATIYAGLRNPIRDLQIYEALIASPVIQVATDFSLAPSTVRAAARRIADLSTFDLRLVGGVKILP